jgi:DNA-binding Xre family transcriptional regulator
MADEPKKMGRPVKTIDFEQLDRLCNIQCTLEEIASFFDVSADTIERRIKEEY